MKFQVACLLFLGIASIWANGTEFTDEEIRDICSDIEAGKECGFIDNFSRASNAMKRLCYFCGTKYSGWYVGDVGYEVFPPVKRVRDRTYWQYIPRVLSSSCMGEVTVRLVFQREEGQGCVKLTAGEFSPYNTSSIVRCELDVPSDIHFDLFLLDEAPEKNCVQCSTCSVEGTACPLENGVWYSDTLKLQLPFECPVPGWPGIISIVVDPGPMTVNIAKFDAFTS